MFRTVFVVAALSVGLWVASAPPSDAASVPTIKVPKSAATLAMASADTPDLHVTNILVNGQSISQPVAPGSTVQISFDWSVPALACPNCLIQGYIGFQGTAATCFVEDPDQGSSGSFSASLTAPDKAGTFLVMVNDTADTQCDPVTSGGGGLPSIAGIVSTITVK